MGRKPDLERRAELLDDVVAYILDRGIHQTSLRPLANQLGTSTYAFVYHFGSKEQLITCALDEVAARNQAALADFGPDGTLADFVHDYWNWNVDTDELRTARIITDARSLVRVRPQLFCPFVERTREDLRVALSARLESLGMTDDDLQIILATLSGALADLVGFDDSSRGAATVERLLERVAA